MKVGSSIIPTFSLSLHELPMVAVADSEEYSFIILLTSVSFMCSCHYRTMSFGCFQMPVPSSSMHATFGLFCLQVQQAGQAQEPFPKIPGPIALSTFWTAPINRGWLLPLRTCIFYTCLSLRKPHAIWPSKKSCKICTACIILFMHAWPIWVHILPGVETIPDCFEWLIVPTCLIKWIALCSVLCSTLFHSEISSPQVSERVMAVPTLRGEMKMNEDQHQRGTGCGCLS